LDYFYKHFRILSVLLYGILPLISSNEASFKVLFALLFFYFARLLCKFAMTKANSILEIMLYKLVSFLSSILVFCFSFMLIIININFYSEKLDFYLTLLFVVIITLWVSFSLFISLWKLTYKVYNLQNTLSNKMFVTLTGLLFCVTLIIPELLSAFFHSWLLNSSNQEQIGFFKSLYLIISLSYSIPLNTDYLNILQRIQNDPILNIILIYNLYFSKAINLTLLAFLTNLFFQFFKKPTTKI
jgi:hypothetical protein